MTGAPSDSAAPFGAALAACDTAHQGEPQYSLPGQKAEIVLDRCYRGRDQLACRFNGVSAEGKALMEQFTRIVEERYPEIANVEGLCKIKFESLVKDLAGTVEFAKRFASARSEFDARTACASKVKQSIEAFAVADLVHGQQVQRSITEAVDGDINRVSAVQEQVSALATKLEASQKAIVALQKIHRAMCAETDPTLTQASTR